MHLRNIFGIVSILCLFLGSCAKSTPTSTSVLVDATPGATASNTPRATVTLLPPPVMENPEYALHLQLDYAQKQASVEETIKYQNQSSQEMSNLVLAVEPNLWLDCFSLNEIRIDDQVSTEYVLDGQKLELSHTLTPMQIVTISISYNLALPKIDVNDKASIIRTQVFGYTTRQLNMVDWYPFVVPYVPGQGWLLNEPATYGEHLIYDSASFDVMVSFAGETIPVIAASGAEIPFDAGKRFLLEKGRSFALSFSPDYLIKSQDVDGVIVLSY